VAPAVGLLVERDALERLRGGVLRRQLARHLAFGARELFQQLGGDGEQVAAGERQDLPRLPEARAHHLRGVAEFLVVAVDARHGGDAGVLRDRDVLELARRLVPVVDAPDERRDQRRAGVGAGHGLGEGEQQRHVAVDALALELLGGADPFPGARQLHQHALARDAGFGVELDEAPRLGHRARGVEGKARVDLGRDPPRHVLQDLAAEEHEQPFQGGLGVTATAFERLLDQGAKARILRCAEQQRRVGGGVLGPPAGDGVDVAGVGDHGRVPAQGLELGGHARSLTGHAAMRNIPPPYTTLQRRSPVALAWRCIRKS
jgi:hypothetical protein